MAKKIQNYNLMVAHSGDTTGFVDTVKRAVAQFCSEYNKYNVHSVSFEVKDFNDATFAEYSQDATQSIVFEQFAGRANIVIALVGEYLGKGLEAELNSFEKEKKQTFVYLYDGGFRAYSHWGTYEEDVVKKTKHVKEVIGKFKDKGFAKIFVTDEELVKHIINDLGRFIQHRQRIKYELQDKSYARFAFDEVDRYRKDIPCLEDDVVNNQKGSLTLERALGWIKEHATTNIQELMRLLRTMLADEFNLDYSDITVSFVWGYHIPQKIENETIIRIDPRNVISLNHSGTPAKLLDLLNQPDSLLKHMILSGASYKWYQYKSYACRKGRYWWPSYEQNEKDACRRQYMQEKKAGSVVPCCDKCTEKANFESDFEDSEAKKGRQYGGSIFCYRIVLNGDASKTNNYASGYLMVSTYHKPFTNTEHDSIRDEVSDSIKNMIDYRIKPQLLVELSQLYIAHLYSGGTEMLEHDDLWEGIEEEIRKRNQKE